jgi:hypothetical protein|tara:strand:+ start:71 stop:679 length:609 start_codon:yes stop_codon:yes gene_type:complete
MDEFLDNDKIIKPYNDLVLKFNNKPLGHNSNFYKLLKLDTYNYNKFTKDKSNTVFEYPYDIENDYIKKYLFGDKTNDFQFREDKFKTIIANNIYYSKILKNNKYKNFISNDYDNLFKDFLSKYIECNKSLITDKSNMKLLKFDKAYNDAFSKSNDKHRRFQKCKLKKQYKKYLECEDISQCDLKEQLHLIILLIDMYIRFEV